MALRPGVTRHRRAMAGIPALAVVGAGLWLWVSANLLPYPPGAVPLLRSPSGSACRRSGCGPSSTTPSEWGTAWDSCSGRRPQSGWRPARSSPSGACPPAAAPARRGSHPRPGASGRPGAGSVGPSISGPRALERPSSGLGLAAPAAALSPRGVAPNRIAAPRWLWRWWAPRRGIRGSWTGAPRRRAPQPQSLAMDVGATATDPAGAGDTLHPGLCPATAGLLLNDRHRFTIGLAGLQMDHQGKPPLEVLVDRDPAQHQEAHRWRGGSPGRTGPHGRGGAGKPRRRASWRGRRNRS